MPNQHIREERLLERLHRMSTEREERLEESSVERLVSSISNHVLKLLNTRQGSVASDGRYGLPNFSHLPGTFSSPETEKIRTTIHEILLKYEPRLQRAEVEFIGSQSDEITLQFTIEAIVEHLGNMVPFKLRTKMSPESTFSIDLLL